MREIRSWTRCPSSSAKDNKSSKEPPRLEEERALLSSFQTIALGNLLRVADEGQIFSFSDPFLYCPNPFLNQIFPILSNNPLSPSLNLLPMHNLKAFPPFQPKPEVRPTVEMITPTGRHHLQPGQQNPRARKQERERHRAQPRSQPTSSAASSSASTPSATGATSGTGSSPGTFSSGARTLTATGRLQPDLEVSTPNPPPRASARPRGPLHHGARNPENDRLLEHGAEARRQQKES